VLTSHSLLHFQHTALSRIVATQRVSQSVFTSRRDNI